MRFSVMFFASGEAAPQETCRTVLETSRLADVHGLDAVWTPERHFDQFGSVFPNPALTSAALATATERIQLRAGSLISPLHHTVRIAEDWSVVDNWSSGRAAVSFGSGWNANDFVLAPDAYASRHQVMLEQIDTVRACGGGGRRAPQRHRAALRGTPAPPARPAGAADLDHLVGEPADLPGRRGPRPQCADPPDRPEPGPARREGGPLPQGPRGRGFDRPRGRSP